MSGRRQRGSTVLEAALFVPFTVLLLMGTVEFGRVAYIYYAVQKTLYGIAKYLGTQQGVNYCDSEDPTVLAAKNFALTGTADGSADSFLPNLTADQIQIRVERFNTDSNAMEVCDCSSTGCDISAGGRPPDAIVLSLQSGYAVQLRIPHLVLDPVQLRPQVRVAFMGK